MSRFIDPPQSEDEKLAQVIAEEEALAEWWQREDRLREMESREWTA